MTTYRVTWEIDIEADSARGAAEKAQQAQVRRGTTATIFEVAEYDPWFAERGPATEIDLALDIYGMTDQPTECPRCGARTEFTERPDGSQLHQCLRPSCRYRFYVEEDD